MRIALVSQAYPPETATGGIGTQTYIKAHGMASLGHEVHVLAHSGASGSRGAYRDGDVNVIRITGFESNLPTQTEPVQWLTYSALVAAELAQLHLQSKFDLIDFPEWACEGYVHLLNRTQEDPVPVVIHLHGPLVMFAHEIGWPSLESTFYRVGRHMEETCLGLADAVFSSSACSAGWCAEHYALDRSGIPVLHTGVDTQLFRPNSLPKEERPTIVFVGQLAANKGVELLLEASLKIASRFENLCLRMIGRGEQAVVDRLRSRAAAAGRPELLELPGFVGREELPAEYSRAHVFAAPSAYEGGPGFVYLEAMACALPVIACAGSGASEAIVTGETGLLIPPNDVNTLADALEQLLSDQRKCREMGQNARDHVVRTADSRDALRRLEQFYRNVIATRQSSKS